MRDQFYYQARFGLSVHAAAICDISSAFDLQRCLMLEADLAIYSAQDK